MEHHYDFPIVYRHVPLRALLAHGVFDKYRYVILRLKRWHLDHVLRKDTPWLKSARSSSSRRERAARETYEVIGKGFFACNHLLSLALNGFYYGKLQDIAGQRFNLEASTRGRRVALAAHPVFWGIRMAVALRVMGIELEWGVFGAALEAKIYQMCDGGVRLENGLLATAIPDTEAPDYLGALSILLRQVELEENLAGVARRQGSGHVFES